MELLSRAAHAGNGPRIEQLSTVHRRLVEAIGQYERTTGEPCPGRYLARRFSLHHKTVQTHLEALHRRGWLKTPGAPVRLARLLD